MSDELKTAVIYARYSSHSQTEQSIEGQLHDGYAFAEKNGYHVVQEYIDRAKTGTKDDRPAFLKMIKDAERHQFQYVIVWKQDRFARNRYDSAVYKRSLSKHGVRVVSVMENINDSPEGIILEGLLEAMAEYYSANLSENIRRGKRESVRKGLFPGGPVAYGYMVQDLRLVPDPRTAPIVKEIFERYVAGERTKEIFTDLNQRGLRAKRNAPFQYSTLQHILDNRLYTGVFCYGDQIVEGCADAIIDQDLFDRAASRRAMNHRNPAAFRCDLSPSLLLGKLFCGECGHKMTGARGTSASGIYFYYQCDGKARRNTCCGMKFVQKQDIEYAVCRVVSDIVLNKQRKTLDALADMLMEQYASDIDSSELDALEAQMSQIERDLEKLVDSLITMPENLRPRIIQRMENLETQKKDLSSRVARMRMEQAVYFDRDDFYNALQITLQDISTRTGQKFIIDHFINSVYLYNDGRLVIYLNQLRGLPYFDPEDGSPDKDSFSEGIQITPPPEIATLKEFTSCSSLYTYVPLSVNKGEHDSCSSLNTYSQVSVNKDEHGSPLLFFLHGHVGIVIWRHVIKNEIIRDHGKIIKQINPLNAKIALG